jgi:hypothetical protein
MSENLSAPAHLLTAGRALFRPSGDHMQASRLRGSGRRRLHFREAGQKVQPRGATLRETAVVATQWNGH